MTRTPACKDDDAILGSSALVRSIVDTAVDAIITIDDAGTVLSYNRGAEAMFGYRADEVLGRNVKMLMPEPYRSEHDGYLARYRATGERRIIGIGREVSGQRKNGSTFPLDLAVSEFDIDGRRLYTGIARDLTERVAAEEALHRSQAITQAIVDTAVDAIITIDEAGRILSVNRGAEAMFGYRAEEVTGRNVKVLMPEPYRSEHDGYLARYRATGERRIIGSGRQVSGQRKDGATFPLDLAVSEVQAAGQRIYAGIARDLTQLTAANDALQASEETFRLLIEGVADHAIFLIDPDGRVGSWNAGAQRLFGYRADEVMGRHVELLHTAGSRSPAEMLAEAADRGVAEEDGPRRRADGSVFTASVVLTAIRNPDGSLRGYAKVLRDVTERRAAEQAAEHMAAQLRQKQRLEAVGQLAGGVAHDFNNLLTVISGTAALLPDAIAAGDDVAGDIHQIIEAAARGAALTRQLLTFSRQEITKPEVLDPGAVVAGVEELLRRSLGEHIQLRVDTDHDRWAVLADRGQLEQVLVNLAVNARDAMPDGGRLTIEIDNVDLDEEVLHADARMTPGRYVRLAVSDTGTGMPPDVMARAFEPFFTTKPYGEGTGLGLATVYGIVTAAGGTVRIYSEVGVGTSVKCYLPATTQPTAAEPLASPSPRPDGRDRTILVVEDESGVRELARRLLARAGFRVLVAAHGADALAVIADTNQPLDLVLTDVVMPGMSGRELADRSHALRPNVPVLFMSGYTAGILSPQGVDQTGELLEKPFTPTTLLRAVSTTLGDLDPTNGLAPKPGDRKQRQ